MVCTSVPGWSKVPARTRSRPCSGLFMRSRLPIPAIAFLALTLAGCEIQPVVSNPSPPSAQPAAPQAVAPVPDPAPDTEVAAETPASPDTPESLETQESSETQADAAAPASGTTAETTSEKDSAVIAADTPADADESAEADPAEPVATEASAEQAAAPEPEATEPSDGTLPETGDLAMAAPPPPPPPPPPPELVPSSLVGTSVPMLRSRLGEADFTRGEGEMKTWQYRFDTCVVDYFLLAEGDVARVVGWAWRAPVIGVEIDETACRRALAGRDSAS